MSTNTLYLGYHVSSAGGYMAMGKRAAAHALHSEMGCICFENAAMGIYFIQDPDGYWLEIVPTR